jgi:outer membrane protein assembly factor BamB
MAAPTPASDGRTFVAVYGTGDVVALDLDGNVQWVRSLDGEYPGTTDGRGLASSPLIVGDRVVVQEETQNVSYVAGIDLKTGANRWRVERPRQPCWTSPVAIPGRKDGEHLVLIQGTSRLSALDPNTGAEVWRIDRDSDPIASAVLQGNVVYVPGGEGLAAFELQGGRPPKLLWQQKKLAAVTASPIIVGDRVCCLRGAILVSGDLKTGEVKNELRLRGNFSASPVAGDGRVCCISEDGLVQVVKTRPKGEALDGSGSLAETILATPALTADGLFVRSDKHLWKITAKRGTAGS